MLLSSELLGHLAASHPFFIAALVGVSVVVMEYHDPRPLGRKERVYLAYTCTSLLITEGSRDRNSNMAGTWNLEAGADVEAMEEGCLLACLACFLIETRKISPGWPHPQWAGPSLINH